MRIISNYEILDRFISKVDQIINNKIKKDENKKEEIWSRGIAVGDPQNLDKILEELGHKAKFKSIDKSSNDLTFVKEEFAHYFEDFQNEYFLNPSFNT